MLPIMNRLTSLGHLIRGSRGGRWLLASAAAVAMAPFAAPAVANAAPFDHGYGRDDRYGHREPDRHDWHDGHEGHDRDRHDGHIGVDVHIGERRPEYETREVRVWVPPAYRTVVDRHWDEPVYRTEAERVWVPDVYEDREVRYRDHGRWCTRTDHVLVTPAHYETRDRQVCVTEGHWENVERQELVSAGHYEVRAERVRVADRVDPVTVINPMLGGLGVRVGR